MTSILRTSKARWERYVRNDLVHGPSSDLNAFIARAFESRQLNVAYSIVVFVLQSARMSLTRLEAGQRRRLLQRREAGLTRHVDGISKASPSAAQARWVQPRSPTNNTTEDVVLIGSLHGGLTAYEGRVQEEQERCA
jgi:hypothetical protein